MRKVILTLNEQDTYEVIKNLVDHAGNKKLAALRLGCSMRTIYRHINGYKEHGKAYFRHGNHQHKPSTTVSRAIRV